MTEDLLVGFAFFEIQDGLSIANEAAYKEAYNHLANETAHNAADSHLDTAKEAVQEAARMKLSRSGNK
jgi:hypothetical protein